MRRRTSSTARSAAMRCPIGWPTSRGGSRRSARPKPSWRRKPKPPPRRRHGRREEAEKKRIAEGRKKNGKTPTPPKQEPEGKTQRNFTDPESRVLLTKDGSIQGYNAQAAVDAEAQIIVAHGLTQSMSDQDQLVALVDGIKKNLGRKPKEASADAGCCSEANLGALADRGIGAYIATGRAKHPAQAERKRGGPLTQAMRHKLKRAGWRSRYRLRKKWSSRCSDRSNRQEGCVAR